MQFNSFVIVCFKVQPALWSMEAFCQQRSKYMSWLCPDFNSNNTWAQLFHAKQMGSWSGSEFCSTLARSLNLTLGSPGGSAHCKAYVLHRHANQLFLIPGLSSH